MVEQLESMEAGNIAFSEAQLSPFIIDHPDSSPEIVDGEVSTVNPALAASPPAPAVDFRIYACQYCSYKSKYRADVCKHQSRKHKEHPPKVINTRTGVRVKLESSSTFSNTAQIRTPRCPKVGRLECDVCNKFGTYSADKFYIHMAAHRNLKPFKCSFCGQRANYKSDVQKHIRNRKKYEQHDGVVVVLSEQDAKATIDSYILERHRQSSQRRRKQPSGPCLQPLDLSTFRFHTNPEISIGGSSTDINAIAQLWCSTFIKLENDQKRYSTDHCETKENSALWQKCSSGVFKRIKCNFCFYRTNKRSAMLRHVSIEHGLQDQSDFYRVLSKAYATRTFFMYENTFGNLLSKPIISKFISYTNDSFSQVLKKVALKIVSTLGVSQIVQIERSQFAEQCLGEFLSVYAANDPYRIDWIVKAMEMLENGTDMDLFDNDSSSNGRSMLFGCSSCPSLFSTNEQNIRTHVLLHLCHGGIQCSMCPYTTQNYNLAAVHNIRAHGSKATMRFVRSQDDSRMLRRHVDGRKRTIEQTKHKNISFHETKRSIPP